MGVVGIIFLIITVIFALTWVVNLGLPLVGMIIPGHLDEPELEKEYESAIHRLINEQRVSHGVAPLIWNEQVAEMARLHSKDMLENRFFDHTNLQGQSVWDRYTAARITCATGGENIYLEPSAFPQSASSAHSIVRGWMDSSGHRSNILNNAFTSHGIGVAVDVGKVYATQNFC